MTSFAYRQILELKDTKGKAYFVSNNLIYPNRDDELILMNLESKKKKVIKRFSNEERFLSINASYLFSQTKDKIICYSLPACEQLGSYSCNFYGPLLKLYHSKDVLMIKALRKVGPGKRDTVMVTLFDLPSMKLKYESDKIQLVKDASEEVSICKKDIVFRSNFETGYDNLCIFDGSDLYEYDCDIFLDLDDTFNIGQTGGITTRYTTSYYYEFDDGKNIPNISMGSSDYYSELNPVQCGKKLNDYIIGVVFQGDDLYLKIIDCKSGITSMNFVPDADGNCNWNLLSDDGTYAVVPGGTRRVCLLERYELQKNDLRFWKSRDLITIKNETGEFKCNRTLLYNISALYQSLVELGKEEEEIEIPNEYKMKEVERILTLKLKSKLFEKNEIAEYFQLN